jgi:hypothetical protein
LSEITSQSAFRIAKNLSIPVSTDPLLYVPDREKAMLWEQVKENFTFENVDEAKVKEWGLKKGAISSQTYKKTLNKDYIKKGVEPDFSKHPKIRDHWDSFVQFKETSKSQSSTQTNTGNAQQKQYFHHLGTGAEKKKK